MKLFLLHNSVQSLENAGGEQLWLFKCSKVASPGRSVHFVVRMVTSRSGQQVRILDPNDKFRLNDQLVGETGADGGYFAGHTVTILTKL
jgi:hypothetical protein